MKYQIPYMVVTKDDILMCVEGKPNEEELIKALQKLGDTEMQNIANRMTDSLMQVYWDALNEAFKYETGLRY